MNFNKIITFSLFTGIIILSFFGCFLLFPDITGEWDGIFSFTDLEDILTGTLDLVQNGTEVTGTADIETKGIWDVTGTIDEYDVELTLTSREMYDPIFQETLWVITGTGQVNDSVDEIIGTWEENFFGSTGTFVLTRE